MVVSATLLRLGRGLLAGGIAGVLVLGIGGRLVMSLIALRAGVPVGYSAGGTFEVILTGLFFGLAGGFVYGALLGLVRGRGRWLGPILGLVYFVGLALFPPPAARSAASGFPQHSVFVLIAFGTVFVMYGFALSALAARQSRAQAANAVRE